MSEAPEAQDSLRSLFRQAGDFGQSHARPVSVAHITERGRRSHRRRLAAVAAGACLIVGVGTAGAVVSLRNDSVNAPPAVSPSPAHSSSEPPGPSPSDPSLSPSPSWPSASSSASDGATSAASDGATSSASGDATPPGSEGATQPVGPSGSPTGKRTTMPPMSG